MLKSIADGFASLGAVFTAPLVSQVDLRSILLLTALVLFVAIPAVYWIQRQAMSAISEV